MTFERIAIMGAGSLGIILGAYIAQQRQVDLIVGSRTSADALNTNGAQVAGNIEMTVPVHAVRSEDMEGTYDLFLYLVKQTVNDVAIPQMLAHSHDQTVICTLQNGVPELSVSEVFGPDRTIGAPVGWGATLIGPSVSQLTTPPEYNFFALGSMTPAGSKYLADIKTILEIMCPVHVSDNLMGLRWGKLLMNAVMSGMSTAIGGSFGDVLDRDWATTSAAYVGRECIQAAVASRVVMDSGELDFPKTFAFNSAETKQLTISFIRKIWECARMSEASMRQDLQKGRRCEIDAINGVVVATGKKYSVPTPMNDLIVEIVKAKQEGTIPVDASCEERFKAKLAEIE
jgi:2-dehydropantoate 2-reductase